MQKEQSSPELQQNRRSAETQTKGERKSMVPEPRVLLEPEGNCVPDADDLVIETFTDQTIDFDDS